MGAAEHQLRPDPCRHRRDAGFSHWWRRCRRGMDPVLDRHDDHRPLRPLAPDGRLPLARLRCRLASTAQDRRHGRRRCSTRMGRHPRGLAARRGRGCRAGGRMTLDWNLSYLPDAFGPLYMGGSVEVAMIRTLTEWLPTYIAEINRQLGAPTLTVPQSYLYRP